MSYTIRMVKLITGELVIGKMDPGSEELRDVALLQIIPTQQGVQMMMVPYGYPFEHEFSGSINEKRFIYEYNKLPEDLETKYLEACTNLTLSTNSVNISGANPSKVTGIIK